MPVRVVGIGAGGHAKVILEILLADGSCEIVGLTDKNSALHGTDLLGVSVLGDDDILPDLAGDGVAGFFVGCGGTGDNSHRRELFERAIEHGFDPVNAIHGSASVSPSTSIGEGAVIAARAVINAGARIGSNVIINTGAVIEHDCIVGDHVHIASGAVLSGSVIIGDGAHVGAGASILQGVSIGENSVVGLGAAVIRDVPPGVTVAGCPAEILKKKD